jgi:hypothetical protein
MSGFGYTQSHQVACHIRYKPDSERSVDFPRFRRPHLQQQARRPGDPTVDIEVAGISQSPTGQILSLALPVPTSSPSVLNGHMKLRAEREGSRAHTTRPRLKFDRLPKY